MQAKDDRQFLEMIIALALNYDQLFKVLNETKNDVNKIKDIEYLNEVNIRNQWLAKLWHDCAFADEEYFFATIRFLRLNNFTSHQIFYNLKKPAPIPFVVRQLPDDKISSVYWSQKLLLDDSPSWKKYCFRQTKDFWKRINESDKIELLELEKETVSSKIKIKKSI